MRSVVTYQTEMATSPELRRSVYQLRYACYHRTGSIEATAAQEFTDEFDTTPNHFSVLQSIDGQPQATIRAGVVIPARGWLESPVHRTYGQHAAFQPFASATFVEASRLCFAPQARRDGFIQLLSRVAALADFHQVQWLIACPRLEHTHAYQSLFGFQPQAEPRPCFQAAFDVQLMAVSLAQLRAYIHYDPRLLAAWSDALSQLPLTRHNLKSDDASTSPLRRTLHCRLVLRQSPIRGRFLRG